MKLRSRFILIFNLFLCLTVAFQGQVIAQVIVFNSVSMDITVRIPTHPDNYVTQLPLQLVMPVVSDIDNDWVLEIISAGYNPETQKSSVYIWRRSGGLLSGWPKEIDGRIENIPAVGDLDGDGDLEIAVSVSKNDTDTCGLVYVWHHDGTLYKGYPIELDYIPYAPVIGDVTGDFPEDLLYNGNIALCDIDLDGKKEIIKANTTEVRIENGDGTLVPGWPKQLSNVVSVGTPVAGDINGDGNPEIFLAVTRPNGNYIYGWYSNGEKIEKWPISIVEVINSPGNYLSLGDIDGDGKAEIISGSNNGYIAGWNLNGSVVFSNRPIDSDDNSIYQPLIGNINNDNSMEIIATSKSGNIYCYDKGGNLIASWQINSELSKGAVLVDIECDTQGDSVNSANDLELLFSANDGMVHVIDLPGDFHPNNIQWGMYSFSPRNSGNYLRDWDTAGWTVFDNVPAGATIESVYDWNRGGRVIELKGAGVNNTYAFKRADGFPLNSKDTTLEWAMRYNRPFYVYASIDTIKGKRYLYYTPTEGNQPIDGIYIHHGLGRNVKDGKWHTFSRELVQDLKDAEPDNEIIDVNAVYIQGSGRIDDIMLLPGLPCVDMNIEVSSNDNSKELLSDDDISTQWISGSEANPWIKYTWDKPIEIDNVLISNITGAGSVDLYIYFEDGTVKHVNAGLPTDKHSAMFDFKDEILKNVKSIVFEFSNRDGNVGIGEIDINEGIIPSEGFSADSYVHIKDGYFFNPVTNSYWIPHGIAYETWNATTGQWQSPVELRNDLNMMAEAGINAIRADFIWRYIETQDNVYDWSRYDMLLEEAQAKEMKVFPVISYQLPPDWVPEDWFTMHPKDANHPDGSWISNVLSYENPYAKDKFLRFLKAVVRRYSVGGEREDLGDTVAGWIIGDRYSYLSSQGVNVEYNGYDTYSQDEFRDWLKQRYNGDIELLNEKWERNNAETLGYLQKYLYQTFDEVDMPIPFGYEGETKGKYIGRDKAFWYDLLEWREESIANFIASEAQAVEDVDPGHLISYAAVGMQEGEEDWQYSSEDASKIAKACNDIGAPLSFWSINNYPWALENSELMTGQWGIERARHDTVLPVMVTETGFTSTETLYPGITEERQAKLIRNSIWESLETGAVGVCVFHWSDRANSNLTQREKGFGIVSKNKEPKPAYFAVKDAFTKMDQINIAQYLVGSKAPAPDIAFLKDNATDSIKNRYESEMGALFGTLERLGYEPTFINDQELIDGVYKDYKAIILPRNQKMFNETFDLLKDIKANGVKIHADSDIPGIMDEYSVPRDKTDWLLAMKDIFGIDATNCKIDEDLEDNIYEDGYETSSVTLKYMPKRLSYPAIGFDKTINMWKYRDGITADGGVVMAEFDNGNPALIFHYDTAISLFSIGDNKTTDWTWEDRYNWMKTIFMDPAGFNIQPELSISNKYVLVDYRVCANGAVLFSLKNYKPNSEGVVVSMSSGLLSGKAIKDLLTNVIIENPCDGTIERELEPDGHNLLLAYTGGKEDTDDTDNLGGTGNTGNQENSSSSPSPTLAPTSTPTSVPITNTTQVLTPDSLEKDNKNYLAGVGGPISLIVFGEGENDKTDVIKSTGKARAITQPESSKDSVSKADLTKGLVTGPGLRTCVGSEYRVVNSGGESPQPPQPYQEPPAIQELSPLEQFRSAMKETTMDKQINIIRAKPEIVPHDKIGDIIKIHKTQSVKLVPSFNPILIINNLVSKFKDFWRNLVKKTQLVCKSISPRYV